MIAQHKWIVIAASVLLLAACQTPSALNYRNSRINTVEPLRSTEYESSTRHAVVPDDQEEADIPRTEKLAAEPESKKILGLQLAAYEEVLPANSNNSFRLTLTDAIGVGLERNPDLIAIRSSQPVATAAYDVARTYPFNPQFQTQVLPYTRDVNGDDAPVSQQHVIVQTFELAGQKRFRTGAAAANGNQVRSQIEQAELLNIAQTERFFFTAIYLRELNDLAESLAKLNEQLVGALERREQAGQANTADVALARIQAQTSLRQKKVTEANYQSALAALRTHLNLGVETIPELVGDWLDWHWGSFDAVLHCPAEDLTRALAIPKEAIDSSEDGFQAFQIDPAMVVQLVANRPDVMAARAAVSVARANLGLADAMRHPNLLMGPMWQRDNSATQYWGVQAQIDLPVVNTGTPLIRQRNAELRQLQITASQLENKAVLEAHAAIQRYERARRMVEQCRGDFDVPVSQALKPFEDQFQAGQIDLLQVLAAQASLVQSQQSFLDLLNQVALAAADVTQMTGLPPEQIILHVQPALSQPEELPLP